MFPYPEHYRLVAPPLVTAFMVLWAILARALFGIDSAVAFYPLLTLFPLNILLHLYLMWQSKGMARLDQGIYAFIHLSLAFVVWTFAIMHVHGQSV